ncbi:serine hydrolase [Bremerella sp. JC770]|uniref:serine hydrolase n=1 Tax=Bremerella sp. JC770 TaxID=3232137 RepID=UPI00345789E8
MRSCFPHIAPAVLLVFTLLTSWGQAQQTVRVAVFQGDGVGKSVHDLIETLQQEDEPFDVERITAEQIQQDALAEFDVLIHPGGSGSKQAASLGEPGRERVRSFVKRGGGYLGVCAGAYLATNDYAWSLNLLDAKVVDRRHWARGNGMVELQLSPAATAFFGHIPDEATIYYGQGPLLGRREWDDPKVPNYESLAIYKTGIAEKGAPEGVMPGTSAIVRTRYGAGRVFCFSPHPELTDGSEAMINSAVHWLSGMTDQHAIEVPEIGQIVRRHIPADSPGGVAVLVTRQGEVLHRRGYGFVKGRHLTTQTPLSLASVTKQFAAMCAAILIEEGRLDVNEKVSHYLPDLDLPVEGRELRVKDLLWHTSGLPNFVKTQEKAAIAEFKQQHELTFLTNATHAQWLATMDVQRPPGQQFEYTNSGYVLLTRVIEVIAREPFHAFQQRRIFDVLGMSETTDSTTFNGSGNMRTTLVDYGKWDRALWQQDPRLLSTEGYQMLFTPGELDNGEPIPYGFGWRLDYRDDKLLIAEHGGVGSGTTAARNLVRRHFSDGTTVAIFVQENPHIGRTDRAELVSEIYEWTLRQ